MTGSILLNKEDIETIIAEKFNVDVDEVIVYVNTVSRGYGMNEHLVSEPVARIEFIKKH